MSILVNQFYANPTTPIWGQGMPISVMPCAIATSGGSPTAYTIEIGGPITILEADTTGLVNGYSYLIMVGFTCQLTGFLPVGTMPVGFGLTYSDGSGTQWLSGTQYFYDSTIVASQTAPMYMSLPFVYTGGSNVQFTVTNYDSPNIEVTIQLTSQAIIQTSVAPIQELVMNT